MEAVRSGISIIGSLPSAAAWSPRIALAANSEKKFAQCQKAISILVCNFDITGEWVNADA
jgi:hypothetical protein